MVGGGGAIPDAGRSTDARQRFVGQAYVRAPAALQLPLLSLGTLGAQAVWSIDMAFAPPYLLELGLSKSAMAAVFVAGPLSGLVVQPLIGALADSSTSKHGRRRPFLAVGAVVCCLAVLMLSFAREIASLLSAWGSSTHSFLAISIAVVAIYIVDFSVNAVTALNRALMIDVAAVEDQAVANAWAARLSGAGSVLSFLIGNMDLPAIAPSIFGKTQIQILSVITCFFVLSTHAVVIRLVQEQVLVSADASHTGGRRPGGLGLSSLFGDLRRQARNLPAPILAIFRIQFFAWVGWFPILFYTTVWVGDIFRAGHAPTDVPSDGRNDEALYEASTRVGSLAMFWHAIVSFVASILLPLVVPSPLGETSRAATPRFLRGLERFRSRCPDLTFWWAFSHFIFFAAMMGTYIASLAQSVFFATLLIAAVGFCWCVTNWVPFGLLGILIQQHTLDAHPMRERNGDLASEALLGESARSDQRAGDSVPIDGSDELDDVLVAHPHLADHDAETQGASSIGKDGTSGHAGSILGLHNLAIVLPQFAVTLVSSAIFALMEPNKTEEGSAAAASPGQRSAPVLAKPSSGDAVGIVLRLGGLSALVAGILAIRFARRYGHTLTA